MKANDHTGHAPVDVRFAGRQFSPPATDADRIATLERQVRDLSQAVMLLMKTQGEQNEFNQRAMLALGMDRQ